jgi:type IV secretion system protein VirB9
VIVPIETPPVIIEKEKPVYIPENQADKARPPATGREAVEQSNRVGILKPQDYSHAAMLYDYDPDWVYEVYARPLRVSDICLQPGERVAEPPFVSDSERWLIGAGVSYEQGTAVQHVYVKPTEPAIDASLIINTDRRVYHIILRSYRETHMPIIRWRYPSTGLPNNIIPPPESATVTGEPFTGVDPRLLSFNYRIIYSLFSKPKWLPYLVYDDGAKTYITFPESVLPRELPAVFENRKDVVNYRVVENVIIIDKLVEQLTIKLERAEITVRKKRS